MLKCGRPPCALDVDLFSGSGHLRVDKNLSQKKYLPISLYQNLPLNAPQLSAR
jgi:hypothetical protein